MSVVLQEADKVIPEAKVCRRCGIVKPLDQFRRDARKKDGHLATCTECRKKRKEEQLAVLGPARTKTCRVCQEVKDAGCFNTDLTTKDGLNPTCRTCQRIDNQRRYARKTREERQIIRQRTKDWVKRNPELYRRVVKNADLKKKYGLTLPEYEQMVAERDNRCDICKQPEITRSNGKDIDRLRVDHDHETGQIRGLLCSRCNFAIGGLRDSSAICLAAASYLQRFGK